MVAESKRSREEGPLAKAEVTPEGSPRISIREEIPSVGRPWPGHIQLVHSGLRVSLGICSWWMQDCSIVSASPSPQVDTVQTPKSERAD